MLQSLSGCQTANALSVFSPPSIIVFLGPPSIASITTLLDIDSQKSSVLTVEFLSRSLDRENYCRIKICMVLLGKYELGRRRDTLLRSYTDYLKILVASLEISLVMIGHNLHTQLHIHSSTRPIYEITDAGINLSQFLWVMTFICPFQWLSRKFMCILIAWVQLMREAKRNVHCSCPDHILYENLW